MANQGLISISRSGAVTALVTLIFLSLLFRGQETLIGEVHERDLPIETLPLQIGEWKGVDAEGLAVRSREVLRLDRYLRRIYTNSSGDSVFVYLGYWKRQSGEYQAAKHSPTICLPASGWNIYPEERVQLGLSLPSEEKQIVVNRLTGEFNRRKSLFYYWFFVGEKEYPEGWMALINISLETFLRGRSDGGIIEISTSLDSESEVDIKKRQSIIESFIGALYPEIYKLRFAAR